MTRFSETPDGETFIASDETVVALDDMDAWDDFARENEQALKDQYGSVGKALRHCLDGGLTLGGGAAPIVRIFFVEEV